MDHAVPRRPRSAVLLPGLLLTITSVCVANDNSEQVRTQLGWGWQDRSHGQVLASDVLGQFVDGDPSRPNFGSYGPYGGPRPHAFFFFAFNAGRYQVAGTPAAHLGIGKLAVPDYWNHRVLLFDLDTNGNLLSRTASGLIGQQRFDDMEIGQGPDRLHFPSACAFDPAGRLLFIADEYNHRVLQFAVSDPQSALRVYGQKDFEDWGYDSTAGDLIWDSTREDVRGPKLVRRPHSRGMFLPRGVACDGRRLFVADGDNHRVLVFEVDGTANGPAAIAVLGQPDFGSFHPNRGLANPTLRSMCFPNGLAVADGHLLVADSVNHRLLVFDVNGAIENDSAAVAEVPLPGFTKKDQPNPPFERRLEGALSVALDNAGRVYVADRTGRRVVVHELQTILAGNSEPKAAMGRFEMSTDLWQMKPGYGGPTGVAVAGNVLYVVEPRGNRVLCFDTRDPEMRAIGVLGQSYGNDLTRPHYNKYGPNNGPDPYGFDYADGEPALSVTSDGRWLLASDPIGGRVLFFPLSVDGLPSDRSARLALGVPSLDTRANSYGAHRFNRAGQTLLTPDGHLFASDFQGSRILHFELPNLLETTGRGALEPLRALAAPEGRSFFPREEFESHGVESGLPAVHVLGQQDFYTGTRGVATQRQLGKEISGLAYDRDRNWLFVAEKLNHRVLIVDLNDPVETFMPARTVLGQPDFEQNAAKWGEAEWHPRGLDHPAGIAYDHQTRLLFVTSGTASAEREIVAFDLSGEVQNGMEPALRLGGRHPTIASDLPRVERLLAIDERHRRLWCGPFALDLSGDVRQRIPLIGWFGLGPHPDSGKEQDTHSGAVPSLLGYSVGACHRFGGAINGLAVNPATGTVYVADTPRYRVLCFQPEFKFRSSTITVNNGEPVVEICGSGGMAPLRFAIADGSLPAGLALDSDSGLIQGCANDRKGPYEIAIEVKSAIGRVQRTVKLQLN